MSGSDPPECEHCHMSLCLGECSKARDAELIKRRKEQTDALRGRSGVYTSADRLTSFFYELMRDHLPVGQVEAIVATIEREAPTMMSPNVYTNGWLAQYAADLAQRLRNVPFTEEERAWVLDQRKRNV